MSETKQSSRAHVPWMHAFEWQQVCCDVFSDELEERCRGYEKLLLWKARQREIPPGIECTLVLSYADLLDKNALANITNAGAFGDREMQMMMSSAIMRFLTHLGVLLGREKSYNEVATSLSIPKWVVQLRNDSAHEKDLPSLMLLREGVNICLEWLHLNYWKKANIPCEVKLTNVYKQIKFYKYLEAWESVNLYILRGFCTMSDVDSSHLKIFLEDMGKPSKSLITFREKLCEMILEVVRTLPFPVDEFNEKLSMVVLQCKTFIPTTELVEIMKSRSYFGMSDEGSVVKKLAMGWKHILGPLQENYSFLPSLIHQLVLRQVALGGKHSTQQLIISHWINVLCCSIIKSCAVHKAVCEEEVIAERETEKERKKRKREMKAEREKMVAAREKITERERKKIRYLKSAKKFDNLNPEWKGGFLAISENPHGYICPRSLVKLVCFSANKFTPIFLPSLLMIVEPAFLSSEMREIEELVLVYTNGVNRVNKRLKAFDRVYNIQDLLLVGDFPQISVEEENEVTKLKQVDESAQDMYQDTSSMYQQWKSPLGSVPWCKLALPSLDIPDSVKWIEHTADSKSLENNKVNLRDYSAKHTKEQKKIMAVNAGLKRNIESDFVGKGWNKLKKSKKK